mmetsp:Transcript_19465/g.48766  ORF Transcript_19465/g.48766 Transcript_19465/m.48766 type:complete len:823 (-) Transcript_19465:925-3393(-)|eukprot:CAMPEP_0178990976 /NCGR_PEP_ID=MMETSP0795-20121207/5263_1 /TAXON_ID=88552 /ORGANISM="Amoebophrya sp., Strain Ameob2" /LENGTH=822 /DNA_ID=CAMNT_0020682617 /DNA_START=396 /DNA_END=2864 /DNA_ORIENTATION=-
MSGGMIEFLERVPIFRTLQKDDLAVIAQGMKRHSFKKGECVFAQGDTGDAFYIVAVGQANVLVRPSSFIKVGDFVELLTDLTFAGKIVPKGTTARVDKYDASRDYPYTVRVQDPKFGGQRGRVLPDEIDLKEGKPEPIHVANLKPGDYFGEQSLLKGKPRNATIKAGEDLECGVIDADLFKQLDLGSKISFAKRKAIQTFDAEKKEPGGDTTKNETEQKLILDAILNNKKLTEIIEFEQPHLDAMVAAAWKKPCQPGDSIISQGDIQAEEFYVVNSGEFEVSVQGAGGDSVDSKAVAAKTVGTLQPGASFGELALLYQAPRAATVTCKRQGTLFVIDRYTFKEALRRANVDRIKGFLKIIDSIRLFDCMLADEKEAVANALVETNFILGETIIKEGDVGNAFYILKKGTIAFTKRDPSDGEDKVISYMDASKPEKGCFFGERSLLKQETRAATARVTSSEAVALALSKERFEEMLGSLSDMIKEKEAHTSRRSKVIKEHKPRDMHTIKHEDLKTVALLGCGGFGAVTLEQDKSSGKTYALKRLSKGFIVKTKMQQGTMREKHILALCDSDFVIKLFATFKDQQYLYFVLEPALGGELYATYHKFRFHGDVKKAKYYSATVVFCFEHLHSMNILYRDLKPENLLLDDKGNCKMTDMGLAKVVNGKTYTTCGTPDYFAPEVIQQTGMGRGVDWWTLGVLTHELMCGHAPFEANDPMETYQKIVRGVNRVRFSYKDADAIDLVKNMLKHQASERLPMRVGGTKNIKAHVWYKEFDWDSLFSRSMTPPFKPTVKSVTDTSNFRANESEMPPNVPYKDDGSNWDGDF